MDTMMEDILKGLECPVCFEYMLPPITQCRNGHNICDSCKPGLQHCPTCRGDLIDVRNRTVEDLSRTIEHPCKFQKFGCDGKFHVGPKEEHERLCRYGPHKCPFYIANKCHWEGPSDEIGNHIKNAHENESYASDEKEIRNFPDYKIFGDSQMIVFTLDNIFFRYSKIIENIHYVYCVYVGSREDDNKYKHTISIKTNDGEQKVSSCLKCPHYLDCIDKEIAHEKCAAFHRNFMKECVNEFGRLPFECEISRY